MRCERVSRVFYPGARTVPVPDASGPPTPGSTEALGSVAYGFGLHSRAIGFEEYGAMFHGVDERVDVESLHLSTEMWIALAHDFSDLTAGRGRASATPAQPMARASRSSCSSRCSARLPVAGLADSARLTWRSVWVSRSSRCSRPWTKFQAPMFSGSSCSHTTSSAPG